MKKSRGKGETLFLSEEDRQYVIFGLEQDELFGVEDKDGIIHPLVKITSGEALPSKSYVEEAMAKLVAAQKGSAGIILYLN